MHQVFFLLLDGSGAWESLFMFRIKWLLLTYGTRAGGLRRQHQVKFSVVAVSHGNHCMKRCF